MGRERYRGSIIDRIWEEVVSYGHGDLEVIIPASKLSQISREYSDILPEEQLSIEITDKLLSDFYALPVRFVIEEFGYDFRVVEKT